MNAKRRLFSMPDLIVLAFFVTMLFAILPASAMADDAVSLQNNEYGFHSELAKARNLAQPGDQHQNPRSHRQDNIRTTQQPQAGGFHAELARANQQSD